jgi:hypothetical protein
LQTAPIVFARHTAAPHPAERQIVTGNSVVVPSRCRFEATGRYAGSCLTKKYSLTAPDPRVINRNIFLIITIECYASEHQRAKTEFPECLYWIWATARQDLTRITNRTYRTSCSPHNPLANLLIVGFLLVFFR